MGRGVMIILMGVSGAGKTTIGKKLAEKLGSPFYDADDFHTLANKEKMRKGIALTDEDRFPWLRVVAVEMQKWDEVNEKTVLSCSALKQKYRDILEERLLVHWVYLKGDKNLIRLRLENRKDHFMNPELLDSQFKDLEEPEGAITVDINSDSDKITAEILQRLTQLKG
jgi:carbohydrate kinase (thermoresistant glucokinase family)